MGLGEVAMKAAEAGGRSRLQRRSGTAAAALFVPLVVLACLLTAPAAKAQSKDQVVEIGQDKIGAAKVAVGKSRTLRTSVGFVDLVVGDVEVADVMPLTDHSLYVMGKKIGTTNVSIFDASKRLVGLIEVEVTYDTPRLADDLERAAPGQGGRVTSANGRTVLTGAVGDAVAASDASNLAKAYGPEVINEMKVRAPQQVMLEVRFIEASRTAGKAIGVNWDVVGKNFQDPTRAALNLAATTGTGTLALGAGAPFGAILGRVLSSGVQADVLVQALEERGLARRLAEPNLITLTGEKASFLAGGEFPIPVASDLGRITIEYKKFGVQLMFTPTVLRDGVINLRIEPEVSQLDFTNAVRTAGVTVPALIVRRASTVIELRDGQSFAIAGLLQNMNTETRQQLPWLADVPILGAMFASTAFERKETDLAIIVTPRLVKPARPNERLRTPLDNVAAANDPDRFLLGKQEVSVAAARKSGTEPLPPSGHFLDLPKGTVDVANK